ncbi:MAG: serine/threonine-protein kinase [Myxococcales bacterium]
MTPLKPDVREDALLSGLPLQDGWPVLGGVLLQERLGRGGMGAVYRGRHQRLGIDVAVKIMVLPRTVPADHADGFVKRFVREAQSTAAVAHENLVRIYDVNSEKGVHYLVMDFIDGESAAQTLQRRGALPEEEATRIVLGAALGLAEAHRKGIVHRDVKPDNIMVDRAGRVRVTDLGLAKSFEEDGDATALTHDGMAMGTPAYMPPEQFVSARDVGPQADVWSLGVTLYRLLTGEAPWSGSSPYDLGRKIEHAPLPDARRLRPGLSEGLWSVLVKCLQKDPALRFRDCGEMAEALRGAAGAAPVAPVDLSADTRLGFQGARAAPGIAEPSVAGAPEAPRDPPRRPSWALTLLLQAFGLGLFYLRPKSRKRIFNALLLPSIPVLVGLGSAGFLPVSEIVFGAALVLAPLLLHVLASIEVVLLCHEDRRGARSRGARAASRLASVVAVAAFLAVVVWNSTRIGLVAPVDDGSFSPEALSRALAEDGRFELVQNPNGNVTSVVFSPDGKLLATATNGRSYSYWNLETGQRADAPGGEPSASHMMGYAMAFAPDGDRLATARADNTVALWQLSTGKKLVTFRGHKAEVTAGAFSPDGRHFATASDERTAALWDAATGERLRQFREDMGFFAVAFSPDGRWLAAGSASTFLYAVDTGDKVRELGARTV